MPSLDDNMTLDETEAGLEAATEGTVGDDSASAASMPRGKKSRALARVRKARLDAAMNPHELGFLDVREAWMRAVRSLV